MSARLHFLRQLERANIPSKELPTFYTTCVRPVAEYACPVFHNGLPQYLSKDLEQLQKRALRIIHSQLTYTDALVTCNLTRLHERRNMLTARLFNEITSNENHKLYSLLPEPNTCDVNLRRKRRFNVPICKTNRLKIVSFIVIAYRLMLFHV